MVAGVLLAMWLTSLCCDFKSRVGGGDLGKVDEANGGRQDRAQSEPDQCQFKKC